MKDLTNWLKMYEDEDKGYDTYFERVQEAVLVITDGEIEYSDLVDTVDISEQWANEIPPMETAQECIRGAAALDWFELDDGDDEMMMAIIS